MTTNFPSKAAEFVYIRTYSRWIEDLKRRETWPETVDRFINFIVTERPNIPEKVIKKIKEKILNFEVMPSMRAMWAAGDAARSDNTTLYNCSFLTLDSIESYAELFYILMCGTGGGYSVRNKFIENLPIIPQIFIDKKETILIPDSRAGWADSVKQLIFALYEGKDIDFDYSNIRPKGSRLMTMGGRASGPAPLITLHNYIREVFFKAQGRKLTSLECSDIANQIADSVVVGGVRRSSQISLSDLNDELMRNAKQWPFPPRRFMANNSAVYITKPTAVEFLKEWSALALSGTGERGIFNLDNAQKNCPKRRQGNQIVGVNPSLKKGTKIWTNEFGIVPIDFLQDKVFTVKTYSNDLAKARCWLSGNNKNLYKINIEGGFEYYCTAEHKWPVLQEDGSYKRKTTLELSANMKLPRLPYQEKITQGKLGTFRDGLMVGFFYGDGWITDRSDNNKRQYGVCISTTSERKQKYYDYFSSLFESEGMRRPDRSTIEFNSTRTDIDQWFRQFGVDKKNKGLPSKIWSECSDEFINGFIEGYLDADSCSSKNSIEITSTCKNLLSEFHELLGFKGIYLNKTALAHENYTYKGKKYDKKYTTYRLKRSRERYKKGIPAKIISIEKTDLYEDVWDISVEHHTNSFQLSGVVTGNCGEVLLRDRQFCNLSEVVIRADDELDDVLNKIETATWLGVIQSTFTYFPYLDKRWKKNCDEERLLGVSLTGQMDNPSLFTPSTLKAMKNKAIKIAKHAAEKLNVNPSVAVTLVKPSGTVSQLVDSSSGIHSRFAKYYIRRYRISSTDPLFKMIKDQGIKVSPENGQENDKEPTTYVISFPIKSPEGSKTRNDMTAIEQLEWYKMIQTNWCEHNASMTVFVKDEEWFEVGNWVYKNWDCINGISFLPHDGGKYQQAPYEEITEDEYIKLVEKQKKIDYSQLSKYELEDNTEGAKLFNCSGDKCEIT